MNEYIGKKLIFWGTGLLAKNQYISCKIENENFDIEFFIDNFVNKKELYDKKIYKISILNEIEINNYLIVICSSYFEDIKNQLIQHGLKEGIHFIDRKKFNSFLEYISFKKNLLHNEDVKIIVGANNTFQKGWISTNRPYLDLLEENDWKIHFEKNSISNIVAEHVWEHITYDEGIKAANRCYEYLKQGGKLRIAVPDENHPNIYYKEWCKENGVGNILKDDEHKIFYNYQLIQQMLYEAGFEKIILLEYFNDEGNFISNQWDEIDGFIKRSLKNDPRNWRGEIKYTSLIVDAIK